MKRNHQTMVRWDYRKLRHSRVGGNPGFKPFFKFHRNWIPAFAGMTILFVAILPFGLTEGTSSEKFGTSFWSHWGDGRAELAGYALTTQRYGQSRKGVAVSIFVTEPFSKLLRVKADPGKHPKSDEFQVMKLNLIRDFPTGLYDYNVMTSAFVGIDRFGKFPAGSAAKISFSSQEWCGHAYDQLLFGDKFIEQTSHSYFDGEADQQEKIRQPENGVSEDVLFLWARGFAEPFLSPGETKNAPLLLSLLDSRLHHKPLSWEDTQFSRSKDVTEITASGEKFKIHGMKASKKNGKTWTFSVEEAPPHRIIKWETSDGEIGTLLKSDRLAYWQMNDNRFQSEVEKLGLRQRQVRMP